MNFKERIRRITPYTPGEQPKRRDIVKLNTNECPYPPSRAVTDMAERIPTADYRLYPDTEAGEIVTALSEVYGVPGDRIYTGVGSDEVLALSFLTFFAGCTEEEPLLFPDITYSFYPVWASLYDLPYRRVPVDDGFRIRAEDYLGEGAEHIRAGGIIIANPNAPTSLCEPVSFIENIVKNNQQAVVICDEAYIDFGGESALSLTDRYENLLIVQTCSKSRALAGLRVGFAFGQPVLIDALKAVKNSFNSYTMNLAAIKLGAAAIRDTEYWHETCRQIIGNREFLAQELSALGFSFPPSTTNFLFAKHERLSGQMIFEELKERGIYVRHWDAPRIGDHLRITVGTAEQIDILINALKEIII